MRRDPLPPATPAFDAGYAAWNGWSAEAFGRFTRSDALAFAAEIAAARRDGAPSRAAGVARPGLALLDIGFGNGAFLGWARAAGHAVAGVEVNPLALERARAAGFDAVARIGDLAPERRFDVITAFDVLEHLEPDAIVEMLDAIAGRLATDGVALARFPNGDSPFGRVNQHGDATHRCTIGSGRIGHFAAHARLRVVTCRAPLVPLAGVDPLRLVKRLALRAGRAVVEWPLRRLYFDGRPIVFDANLVAVMRRASDR